jgi:quinol---cytochrome-c reductase cytochrome c subunit
VGRLGAIVGLAVAAAVVVGAASRGSAQTSTALPTASPAGPVAGTTPTMAPAADLGLRLYLRDCAWCHGTSGAGTGRGPSLVGVGAASSDFMLSTGRMPVVDPADEPRRRSPRYTPEEIRAIDQVIAGFGEGPPIPAVDPATGNLVEGQQLYELNCAACHSSTATGGALTNGLVAPDLRASSAREIAEAVRIGGAGLRTGNMPRFDAATLSDRQLDAVVRYVIALRDPVPAASDAVPRGGIDLERLGPVAEGFIAWFVGLLILVGFVRFIGTRANE